MIRLSESTWYSQCDAVINYSHSKLCSLTNHSLLIMFCRLKGFSVAASQVTTAGLCTRFKIRVNTQITHTEPNMCHMLSNMPRTRISYCEFQSNLTRNHSTLTAPAHDWNKKYAWQVKKGSNYDIAHGQIPSSRRLWSTSADQLHSRNAVTKEATSYKHNTSLKRPWKFLHVGLTTSINGSREKKKNRS